MLSGGVVSNFEEQVIKEKLKLARKESERTVEPQCATITSSSPTQDDEKTGPVAPVPAPVPVETDQERADRRLWEKEEEVRKLDAKRIMLENYYKAKVEEKKLREPKQNSVAPEKSKTSSDSRRVRSKSSSRQHSRSKKRSKKEEASAVDSEDDTSDDDTDSSEERSRKKKKKHSEHKSHHKSSKRRHSKESRRNRRSEKKSKRDRRDSSSEDLSSSEERRHQKKRQKKSGDSDYVRNNFEHDLDTEAPPEDVIQVNVEVNSSSSPKVDLSIVDDLDEEETEVPQQLKLKSLDYLLGNNEEKNEHSKASEEVEIKDLSDEEFVAETGKSFMSVMGELETPGKKFKKIEDKKDEQKSSNSRHSSSKDKPSSSSHKSSKSEHKSSKSSEHKSSRSSEHKSSKSSDHKSSRSSEHKSKESSEHKPSKSSELKSRKSSDHKSSRSSEHKASRSPDHKSSRSSGHKSSRHKSSKSPSKSKEEKSSRRKESEDEMDIPDLSEELALLPDDMDAEPSPGEVGADHFEKVADGLEDIFAGVEDDDELQRVFDSYKEEETITMADPSQKKSKEETAVEKVGVNPPGRKRTALGGPQVAERRPLHMKKPSTLTPAQAMHERYKKIQALKQQQLLEERLTEITEEPSSSSSSGGKLRVAHSSAAAPVVLSKVKQQVRLLDLL